MNDDIHILSKDLAVVWFLNTKIFYLKWKKIKSISGEESWSWGHPGGTGRECVNEKRKRKKGHIFPVLLAAEWRFSTHDPDLQVQPMDHDSRFNTDATSL